MTGLLLEDSFFDRYWRESPVFMPGRARCLADLGEWEAAFIQWCRRRESGHIFFWTLGSVAQAATVEEVEVLAAACNEIISQDTTLTVLLNDVERVDDVLGLVHEAFGVGQDWRCGDVVATLSGSNSGIGFHGGNEDGFIVQLSGQREWRLWRPEILPQDYRRSLLGAGGTSFETVPIPVSGPDFTWSLVAGDVLYIPPLWGHEGRTLQRSVSLSVEWRGVTADTFLKAVIGTAPSIPTAPLSRMVEPNGLLRDLPRGEALSQATYLRDLILRAL
jgi:50S ribosomal protein L16 3-hydroxylase